jgi:hypothetical protein
MYSKKWRPWQDSNLQPPASEADGLSIGLQGPISQKSLRIFSPVELRGLVGGGRRICLREFLISFGSEPVEALNTSHQGKPRKYSGLTLAVGGGFEPPVPVRVQLFSKQPH